MVGAGITAIITTPHLDGSLTRHPDRMEVRLRDLDESFAAIATAAEERHPELTFERGCEIMLDRPDVDLSSPRIRLGGTRFALIEWPRLQIPPGTPQVLGAIRGQDVRVLIAHPERYSGYDEELSIIPRWREEGALLQMNYGSLLGRYGPQARARAIRLLESGWVDCLSTDFHGRPSLGLFVDEAKKVFQSLGAEASWDLLTQTNPHRIRRDEEPLSVPPVEGDRGVFSRLWSLFQA
jgi:protein-tyrosine phosphatase